MGTIYMKATMSDFNKDNIDNVCLKFLNSSEIHQLASQSELREVLLSTDINRDMQERLYHEQKFTDDEALQILNNCSYVIYPVYRWYQYPIDVIIKNIHKLDISEIEYQNSLTPEFVEKYHDQMAISHFIAKRVDMGDIMDFVHIPVIGRRYMQRFVKATKTREEIEHCITKIKTNVDIDAMNVMLDRIYNTPINAEVLTDYYTNDPRADHSVTTILNHFKNYSTKPHYDTWQEYVEDGGSMSLAEEIFNNFYRDDILKFCNFND